MKILSIVIPTYNMEKYLDNCLSSLIVPYSQMSSFEAIIVNDGSTDKSLDIAKEYHTKYPDTFIIIDKKNGNYGSCINAALKVAKGKYIKILDADDSFCNENFIGYLDFLNKNTSDAIVSDYKTEDMDGKTLNVFTFDLKGQSLRDIIDLNSPHLHMHAIAYKTENLKKLKYIQSEGISYTDQEWMFEPMSIVNTVAHFNKIIYIYRLGRDGQTVDPSKYEKSFWQEIVMVEHIIEKYTELKCKLDNNSDQFEYLHKRLLDRITHIYFYYFKKFESKHNHNLVVKFDKFLLDKSPEVYELFNNKIWDEGRLFKNYKYIKQWRKKYKYKTPLIHIAFLYAKIRHILNPKHPINPFIIR